MYSGLLATIDPTTDPVACYESASPTIHRRSDSAAACELVGAASEPPGWAELRRVAGTAVRPLVRRSPPETRVNLFESIIDMTLGGAG